MKLKFLFAALSFGCLLIESAYCGKFSELEGEAKLEYAKNKYVAYVENAFDVYDSKAEQNLKEPDNARMSDNEVNEIFSKPLKWCAKYLFASSVSNKEDIPEKFNIYVAKRFNALRDKAAFDPLEEIEPGYVTSMENRFSEIESEIGKIYRNGVELDSEEIIEKCIAMQEENDSHKDLFDQVYKQQPYVFIEALEDLFEEIQRKSVKENIKNRIKKNYNVSYLYHTLEDLLPDCLSQHLPEKKKVKNFEEVNLTLGALSISNS